MRKIVSLSVLILTFSVAAVAQDTVTISLKDLQQLQRIAVERDFYKDAYDDEKKRSADWERSAVEWKGLFEKEQDRADRVQGGRINELLKANTAYKDQAENDRQRLGELEFKLRKANSAKKWYFLAGFGTGTATGLYGGSKINF
ncbi:MAG: hypothetical protein AB7J13_11315 [Pyrinomonadaceae bacterium]